MPYMIGVDIGTTSTKAVLYDLKGSVIEYANIGYPLYQEEDGMAEQDPEEIYAAVTEAITQVNKKANLSSSDLKGVAFSAAMHSLILLDKNHKPLTRSITWADNRASKWSDDLNESGIGHEIYLKTGTPIHPMSPLSKLIWLKNEKPDLFNQASYFVGIKDYILYQLFDRLVIDHSLASATGLFNIFNLDWDEQALSVAGVTPEKLPELVETTYQLTGLDKEFSKKTGISRKVPFIIGASDGVLSNLGVDAIDPGVAAVTIGTSGAVRMVIDHPVTDPKGRLFCYALAKDKWVIGGPVNNGGIVFRWLRDEIFTPEKITAEQMQIDPYEIITQIAEKVPAGSDGLLFHPYLGGERAPLWDANARGSFFGLTRQHTRAHMARAVLEGIVFNLDMVMLALTEVSGSPTRIQATGGFAQSSLWRQLLADIFEQEVTIPESFESSCLGAAVLGMESLHLIADLSAVENMIGSTHVHQPQKENFEVYRELLPIFVRLSRSLSSEYKNISDFQRKHYHQI
ncbi:gluconokinase [Dellaglioa carnosa]|uniref:gluconokinase n=1 Tax=Dellaglioa carnosa TaxID=2995136 RepID=UPI0022A8AD6C|nr:gluconokinase [Dellaglioa carnosa]MCZ2492517.1 gluconokinase [Dellaglioa carnosa]